MELSLRTPVENDKRRIFTRKQRAELFQRSGGKCDLCGGRVTGRWIAGHVIAHSIGGRTEIENGRVECLSCSQGTHKADTKISAKVRRLANPKRPKGAIRSRGFDKNWRRKVNGKTERREPCGETVEQGRSGVSLETGEG